MRELTHIPSSRRFPTGQAGAGHAGGGAEQRAAAAKHNFRVISGFAPDQLQRLRSQIVAFKKMKRNEWDFTVPGRPGITAAQHMAERKRAFPGMGAAMGAGAAAAAAARAGINASFSVPARSPLAGSGAPRGRPPGAKNKTTASHGVGGSTGTGTHAHAGAGSARFVRQEADKGFPSAFGRGPAASRGASSSKRWKPPPSVTTMPSWYRHPKRKALFELVDEGAPEHAAADEETLRHSGVRPIPLHYDARAAVEGEADRRLERARAARAAAVQSELRALDAAEARAQNRSRGATSANDPNDLGANGVDDAKPPCVTETASLAEIRRAKRRLKVEEKCLKLVRVQDAVRARLVETQRELAEMGERQYRKLVREGERMKELAAKDELKRAKREKEEHFKQIKEWRRVIAETASEARELSVAKNRAVLKAHEKMAKDFARRRRDEQAAAVAARALRRAAETDGGAETNAQYLRRVEALKANDMEAYRALLAEARGREGAEGLGAGAGGEAGADERYASLQEFLEKTEGYLSQLGGKIAALKLDQQRSEAAARAAAEAEAAGATEEEAVAAAQAAADAAAAAGGRDLLDVAKKQDGGDSKQKYYALAHTESEKIVRQPRMLTAGTLRDYQLVSLQWMISLYNNRLNGILADEMGLGKTVQVCALIAYLWESKQNYGPHLIIVPNAVIVNWKSEIKLWLKNMAAVYYVGGREERAKIFAEQVLPLKFNVLVTTYEFIMRDRAKLSKVNWQYVIIDEAQRLKDREGRLSRDLDRFRCVRRLLLTGTPLQNDLNELWSLLNLLLPQVFDNAKIFQQWFGDTSGKKSASAANLADGVAGAAGEEDWMEKEKKIIVVSRLHQILEPFMLRRLVQDVERKLPPKVTIAVHCPFSAYQASVYDWVRSTGTIRVAPDAKIGLAARANFRGYLPLQNRCMELRKLCNHPALNYPAEKGGDWRSGDALVRACGKLWVLDRLLVKLRRAGHRVLLFSTMTKLLDLLEVYLKWRRDATEEGAGLEWCRIDGSTALDDRETAITEFNARDSNKFLFLLSIRAAGRGLNLQSADTVVVYDPDPNPKNEEQAVARSHRIGQKREVRCIHLEAVVDVVGAGRDENGVGRAAAEDGGGAAAVAAVAAEVPRAANEPANEPAAEASFPLDDRTWGTGGARRYAESIESVVRNVIQAQKIEMADEIINAGRFDQRTTHAERRETLEKLMQDQASAGARSCAAPSMRELNRQIARTPEEIALFDAMDGDATLWPGPLAVARETPRFIAYDAADRAEAVAANAKPRPGRAGDAAEAKKAADEQALSGVALGRGERSRGGYVPGAYRAADAALTGADADAVRARAAERARAAAAEESAPSASPLSPATVPAESDSAALGLEVIEAEDSEVTQDDAALGGDDVGVVDFDPEEEEEEEAAAPPEGVERNDKRKRDERDDDA